jgi:hypothetical protein
VEEVAEGAGVAGGGLSGFDHHETGVAGALFGDAAVIGLRAGLVSRGSQSKIGGGVFGGGKARGVAEGSEEGVGPASDLNPSNKVGQSSVRARGTQGFGRPNLALPRSWQSTTTGTLPNHLFGLGAC